MTAYSNGAWSSGSVVTLADMQAFTADAFACNVTPSGATTSLSAATLLGAWIDPRAFGAKCDGVSDDTAPLSAALASGKQVLLPAGTTVCNSSIIISGHSVRLAGQGLGVSILKFTGGGNGIAITNTAAGRAVHLSDLSIQTSASTLGVGLSVDFTGTDLSANADYTNLTLTRIGLSGTSLASGWAVGLHVTDATNAIIQGVNVVGYRNTAATTQAAFCSMANGIWVSGSAAVPTNIRVLDCSVYNALTAFSDDGFLEDVQYRGCVAVGVLNGFVTNRASLHPRATFTACHANVFNLGFSVSNAPQALLTDCVVYKSQYCTTSNLTKAIVLSYCDQAKVHNCTMMNSTTDRNVGGDWYGVTISSSNYVSVQDCFVERATGSVVINGTSGNCTVRQVVSGGTFLNAIINEYADTSTGGNNLRSDGPQVLTGQSNVSVKTLNSSLLACADIYITVEAGQVYQVHGALDMTGGTAGNYVYNISPNGDSTATLASVPKSLQASGPLAASTERQGSVSGVIKIATRGTLHLTLYASHSTSATVPIGGAAMTVVRL